MIKESLMLSKFVNSQVLIQSLRSRAGVLAKRTVLLSLCRFELLFLCFMLPQFVAAEDQLTMTPQSVVAKGTAATAKDQERFESIRKALRRQKCHGMEFRSQLINKTGQVVNQQQGRLYYQNGKFRFEADIQSGFKNPKTFKMIVVYDGKKTYRYNGETKTTQVLDKRFLKGLPVSPLLEILAATGNVLLQSVRKVAATAPHDHFSFHAKPVGVATENLELSFNSGGLQSSQWFLASPKSPKDYVIWRHVTYQALKIDKVAPDLLRWSGPKSETAKNSPKQKHQNKPFDAQKKKS